MKIVFHQRIESLEIIKLVIHNKVEFLNQILIKYYKAYFMSSFL